MDLKTDAKPFLPVLLGGDANVYGMARCFYEGYGVTAAALCRRALPAVRYSRLVRATPCPGLERGDLFVEALTRFAAQHQGRPLLLVPCADSYALLLARHAATLGAWYHFAIPTPQTVLKLGTKQPFAAACAAAGLKTPATVAVTADLSPQDLALGWPVVVKPADSIRFWHCRFAGRRKVFLAEDAAALRGYLAAAFTGGYRGAMLLQQYIPGGDDALRVINAYCDQTGAVTLFAAARCLLEEHTPEGRGNYGALLCDNACIDPVLRTALCALLQREHWRGFANFDLKYHAETGEPYLFEMNPRQGRAAYYAAAMGQNPAAALCRDLLHREPCAAPPPRCVLWHTAPYAAVRRLTDNRALWRQAAECPSVAHLVSPDEGPARRLWYAARQLNYYRKLARWG